MKKSLIGIFGALLASQVFAGGIENKSNMSTGYLRNPSRNAEAERPEAAFYNIGGTGFMEDGLYIEAGDQFIVKEYKNTLNTDAMASLGLNKGSEYTDDTFVYLYPNVDIVFKKGALSVFGNFGIYAGGGSLEYSEGTALTSLLFGSYAAQYIGAGNTTVGGAFANIAKKHSVNVTSITYGEQIGVAYNFNNLISVAAGVRFLEGTLSMEIESDGLTSVGNGSNKLACDADAFGISPVFGIHARPVDKLDLALQYQMATKLEYEVSNVKGNLASNLGITEGKKYRNDLAHVFNLGAGYRFIDPLYVSASFNYYLNSASEFGTVLGDSEFDDTIEFAVGADYKFNEKLLASLGFAYGKQGTDDENNNVFNPILDSFQVGAGLEFLPIENLTLTAGATYVKYFDTEYNNEMVKLAKDIFMFSIGATYKLPM